MNGKERITAILKHQPVDRVGIYEHFWNDTYKAWEPEIKKNGGAGQSFEDHFDLDMIECWAFNLIADLDYKDQVVSENEDTVTVKNGNLATLKRHKFHDTTPEHVKFDIVTFDKWKEITKPLLLDKNSFERRINFEGYRKAKKHAAETGKFFVWSGVNVFECIHPVTGHVDMLMGMIDDPEWVTDMCETFAYLTVELQKILFEREGLPDGIWYYEDMGYKGAPFMSPAMYDEFIYPAHKYTIDYAKSLGLPVIMHSCGFVEPLLDGMVKAGIDCLQVIEIKAGMDLLRIHKKYGDRLALMGGIDVREIYSNDRARIDKELESKLPYVMDDFGYTVHSDHSIPKTVNYDIYKYFIQKAKELGTYK